VSIDKTADPSKENRRTGIIAERMTLTSGTKLGPYEIESLVGAGGMGEVYRAHDARLNRTVAIKILPSSFSADRDRLQRFAQEARAAAALNHPNILSIFDIGEQGGAPYVVSELLEGETLRARLKNGSLPIRKVIDYALQVARGLAAAHEKGIVHRDLKPENLFLTNDGRVKILDFGLAKLTRPETEGGSGDAPTVQVATEAGVVMGTAGYMSPEQVRGKPADHRSDVFTFGAILYEMVSGKRAFHGESAADTMSAILKEETPELSETARNVPPGLERIVRHCLEKHPSQRFQSAGDLAFDLEALTEVSTSTKSGAQAAVQQADAGRRRPQAARLWLRQQCLGSAGGWGRAAVPPLRLSISRSRSGQGPSAMPGSLPTAALCIALRGKATTISFTRRGPTIPDRASWGSRTQNYFPFRKTVSWRSDSIPSTTEAMRAPGRWLAFRWVVARHVRCLRMCRTQTGRQMGKAWRSCVTCPRIITGGWNIQSGTRCWTASIGSAIPKFPRTVSGSRLPITRIRVATTKARSRSSTWRVTRRNWLRAGRRSRGAVVSEGR